MINFLTSFSLFHCRRYGTKCSGCGQGIAPSDLVRKPRDKVFHLNCFTCCICRKQLSTGEQLYVLDDNKFICKDDYMLGKGHHMTGECQDILSVWHILDNHEIVRGRIFFCDFNLRHQSRCAVVRYFWMNHNRKCYFIHHKKLQHFSLVPRLRRSFLIILEIYVFAGISWATRRIKVLYFAVAFTIHNISQRETSK